MLRQALAFLLETVFNLFVLAALVRFWMQALRAPARNPLAQFTMALTNFAVRPLRRVVPGLKGLDLASLLVAWVAEFVLLLLLAIVIGTPPGGGAAISALFFLAAVKLVRLTVYIIMGAVLIQALLTWVNPFHPVAPFFEALTRPFVKPFQKAIPPIGGVDVTPIIVLIACQLVLMLPVAFLEAQCLVALGRGVLGAG